MARGLTARSFLSQELLKQRIWLSLGQLAERMPEIASLSFLKDKRLGTECRSSLCPRFFYLFFQDKVWTVARMGVVWDKEEGI